MLETFGKRIFQIKKASISYDEKNGIDGFKSKPCMDDAGMKEGQIWTSMKDMADFAVDCISKNFKQMHPFFNTTFYMPEIDLVYAEICRCLLFALSQASITLTNHLLEKHLKLMLIYNEEGRERRVEKLSDLESLYKEASRKYNPYDLDKTINVCCSKGLITKDMKKILHNYRITFRNGFSHADMAKIFGDTKIPLAMGSFNKPDALEIGEFEIANTPLIQGVAQKKMADATAFNYFCIIHNLLVETLK